MSDGRENIEDAATDRDPVSFGASTPPGEWVMAAVGALVVGLLLAVLIHQGLTSDTATPTFRTQIVSIVTVDDEDVVTVEVTNTGGTAASAITVTGDVASSPDAQARVDHLAPGASATVALVVPAGAAPGDLPVRVTGFRHP